MSEWADHLSRAATQTFEEMCFMLPEEPEGGEKPAVETAAYVRFEGYRHGSVAIWIRGHLVDAIVSNMLGEDEGVSDQDRVDGIKEIANVICGNALTATMGEDKVFNLSPPQIFEGAHPPYPNGAAVISDVRTTVYFDEGVVDVALLLVD